MQGGPPLHAPPVTDHHVRPMKLCNKGGFLQLKLIIISLFSQTTIASGLCVGGLDPAFLLCHVEDNNNFVLASTHRRTFRT